ncbi:hypothetical protein F511_21070 [Dorcoceras hygrometricum]|uniref:Uncharacterized protein n=1 Tax=Dorcoceras hygrometricum TaxID=472368 RepID=A0A2Z7CR36_9LAMI|nr:hypothetical protein F511_21070 [Dorcoceras hygrometricum]
MDRIGDFYRNLPRRADVIVTTIGNSKFWNRGGRPPPPAVALPPRAIVRARQRDDRAMNAHVARPGETMCANYCATPPLEARCLAPPWAIAGGRLARFCCTPLRRSTPLVCCAPWSTLAGRFCNVLLRARLSHVVDGAPRLSWPRAPLAACAISSMAAAGRPPLRRVSGDVVTAGMISSRVLVRACPGQPMKFSGRYTMSGPVLVDFEILTFWA